MIIVIYCLVLLCKVTQHLPMRCYLNYGLKYNFYGFRI